MTNNLVPKNKHALIRISKIILNTDDCITERHVDEVRAIIKSHLDSGMSPANIKEHYNINYTDFGMFIKNCLGMKILSCKEAVNNYNKKVGIALTEPKKIYQSKCGFKFNPYSMPEIPGYDKLLELGMYHPNRNPNGVCRDHIVSVEFGWRNNIDPNIISSPYNCQFITNAENISKNASSWMTIEELVSRINSKYLELTISNIVKLPRTETHKANISKSISKYMCVTNGTYNLKRPKTSSIPEGYRRGMTRNSKKK